MKVTNTIKSIAIGSFDGLHKAHQRLISEVEALVIIERNGGYLTPGYKRALYTDRSCCFYHFDRIKSLSAEEFVWQLKEDFPHLEKIVVGYDFAFGKDKMGDASYLQSLFDGEVMIIKEVKEEGVAIHSRTIKTFLQEGDLEKANAFLGRCYRIDGRHIRGQGLGKKSLVPTLNLQVEGYQLPLEGVYATRTKVDDVWYDSVSFIGHRVTTDGSFAVETHLIEKTVTHQQGALWIEFVHFLRPNQKFDTLEALKRQIGHDIAQAKELLS